jgi:hypothetical protein
MLSIISHPHTTLLRAFGTSARIPFFVAHGLYLTSGTAYSAHSSCGLRVVRPSSLAIHSSLTLVILATLKSSNNCALRTAYDQILDDLDDDKVLAFAHIQTVCARLFGVPRSNTRIHLTASIPRALRRAPRRSKPSSTTSTSDKGAMNSPTSSVTPLKNMVNSLGRFSSEQASLALSGTSLLQSLPSSWPPRNTSPARSPETLTMTMTLTNYAAAPYELDD